MLKITKEELIDFEKKVFDLFEDGQLPYVMHFCGGNEDQLIDIFKNINEDDYVFSTHRAHYHYLLKGGTQEELLTKIKDGNSMFLFSNKLRFLSSSVLAGCAGIAVGVAQAIKNAGKSNRVWCFIGDGAEDEGHFYEAVMYAYGHDLPLKFIIEDNNRSVDTNKQIRRGKNFSISWPNCVERYNYTPTYPHIGTGTGKFIKFSPQVVDRYIDRRDNGYE